MAKRRANFNADELHLLVNEVEENHQLLFAGFKDLSSAKLKKTKWHEIAVKINGIAGGERTGDEVRAKWSKYQSMTKNKYSQIRKQRTKTGGGPPPLDTLDDTEKRVLDIMGSTAIEGIQGGVDTDDHGPSCSTAQPPTTDESHGPSSSASVPPKARQKQRRQPPADSYSEKLLSIEEKKLELLRQLVDIRKQALEVEKERLAEEKGKRFLEEERLAIAKETLELKKQKKK
ncbi:myb/SANT-like DNA-binding domain-containing protein 4 [Strongylocentrotus purpuratus]|uniref:Myb-like domain-containing protein n=1 Tax=Strongylocentrotus purpuratus TaxID=7668 RepID=A0A7M7HHQ2_STRPU|nr:myb/SANT-like DNA-binding domain-containing protein 4 [Strongylocentrotus purpuratus]|eukprot:XP_011677463.1 PREDICTED: myb/SANT-like DNA-binding domain-containing protein 4 [Strongylocentrotus purpuratus]